MKKVYIGGCEYKYSEIPKVMLRGKEYYGTTSSDRKIKVCNTSGQHRLVTTVHEVIHATANEFTTNKTLRELDEDAVSILSNQIVGALRQLKKIR